MATKILIKDGKAHAVYDDRFRCLMECLGVLQVKRASDVNFENGDWVARLPGGEEIARGKVRADVIAAEVSYLEARL